jgi:hypothetical protein
MKNPKPLYILYSNHDVFYEGGNYADFLAVTDNLELAKRHSATDDCHGYFTAEGIYYNSEAQRKIDEAQALEMVMKEEVTRNEPDNGDECDEDCCIG